MSCWFVAATVLIGVLKSPVVDSCSMPVGWRPPTTEELIEGASEVLFAVVRGTFPDTSGRPWSKNLYTAEVAVFCIMKGQQTPPVLNITDVGYVPGLCVSTSLQVNDTYLILASALDDVYRADRTIPAIWQEVYDIAGRGICGLQKVYPSGVDEATAAWICPTPEECNDSDDTDEISTSY